MRCLTPWPGVRAAGIEHEPGAVRAADHRAGPGGHVIKRRAAAGASTSAAAVHGRDPPSWRGRWRR